VTISWGERTAWVAGAVGYVEGKTSNAVRQLMDGVRDLTRHLSVYGEQTWLAMVGQLNALASEVRIRANSPGRPCLYKP